jgi:hypothetical protein
MDDAKRTPIQNTDYGVAGGGPTPTPAPKPIQSRGVSRSMSKQPKTSPPVSTPATSRSSGVVESSLFNNKHVLILVLAIGVSLLTTIGISVTNTNENTSVLSNDSARTWFGILSIVFILVGIVSLIIGKRDVNSWWGFIGYIFLVISIIPLNITLTTISLESLNSSNAAMGIFFGSFVLTLVYSMVYYGSTGTDTTRTAIFYGSSIMLLLYAIFYTIVFGNPVGISTTIPDSDLNSLDSNEYTIVYGSDNELNGVFKRKLFDQVYLSVAYPTLGVGDSPPLHNSSEIRGAHYLSNYGKYLKMGGSAFLFDIFYESNASSPNVNTWRVGTINTQTGIVQNRRTISLASVLSETNKAIEMNPNNHRLIYLFLNPRYLTSQKEIIPQLEDSLADLIKDNLTFITLPSLSITIPQNQKIESQNLNNARQQVGVFLGGTRLVSSLSSKLKNVIHGAVNFTDCYIRTDGAQAYNAIAYDPEQSNRRMDLGVGSFAGTNESRLTEFVPQDSLRSVQSSFVATLPNTPSPTSNKVYESEVPVYISHSVCFPFVYPNTFENYSSNQEFFQGFAPIVSPKEIISMIFSNRDGENEPARQRMNAEMRCTQMYNNARVLNPSNDEEWSNLIKGSGGELAKNNWCKNYDKGRDGPTSVNVENSRIFPLVLYNPLKGDEGGYYSGGMIPKPALVQTKDGNIYQLRQVIQQETRVAQDLD